MEFREGTIADLQRLAAHDRIIAIMNAFSVLNSLFDPSHPSFTEAGVQTLLALKSSKAGRVRMEGLAEKANQGTLSADEHRGYET